MLAVFICRTFIEYIIKSNKRCKLSMACRLTYIYVSFLLNSNYAWIYVSFLLNSNYALTCKLKSLNKSSPMNKISFAEAKTKPISYHLLFKKRTKVQALRCRDKLKGIHCNRCHRTFFSPLHNKVSRILHPTGIWV